MAKKYLFEMSQYIIVKSIDMVSEPVIDRYCLDDEEGGVENLRRVSMLETHEAWESLNAPLQC